MGIIGRLFRVPILVLAAYGGLLWLTYWGYGQLPSGFIPSQDKGYLVASVQMPDATSADAPRLPWRRSKRSSWKRPASRT